MKLQNFFLSRIQSFKNAIRGWWYVVRTQRNAWIHAVVTVLVVLLAVFLKIQIRDWAVLLIAISIVWLAEFLNSALESVVDLASPQQHPLAMRGKDVGAAAVLITAIASVIIGFLVLGPPLWNILKDWTILAIK
ncbi:diacylglycerol kinase family protein [Chloroflexota bacterium]